MHCHWEFGRVMSDALPVASSRSDNVIGLYRTVLAVQTDAKTLEVVILGVIYPQQTLKLVSSWDIGLKV